MLRKSGTQHKEIKHMNKKLMQTALITFGLLIAGTQQSQAICPMNFKNDASCSVTVKVAYTAWLDGGRCVKVSESTFTLASGARATESVFPEAPRYRDSRFYMGGEVNISAWRIDPETSKDTGWPSSFIKSFDVPEPEEREKLQRIKDWLTDGYIRFYEEESGNGNGTKKLTISHTPHQ